MSVGPSNPPPLEDHSLTGEYASREPLVSMHAIDQPVVNSLVRIIRSLHEARTLEQEPRLSPADTTLLFRIIARR